MLSRGSANLHDAIGAETSDGVRGMRVGAIVAAIGHAIGGAVISLPPVSLIQVHWAIAAAVGAVVGAIAGAMIGYFIGAITGQQVQAEYEAEIARGGELLAVNTDGAHASKAYAVLQRCGGEQLSTAVHGANHHHAQGPAQQTA